MSKLLHAVIGAFAAVGVVFTAASVDSLVYVNRRLRGVANDYKYGPARHLAYYSDIVHRASRGIDAAAVNMFQNASSEDKLKYDTMVDRLYDDSHRVK